MTVLLVDDAAVFREYLLQSINWQAAGISKLYVAKNGQEGLELADQVKPDIIFADIEMPVVDGLAFAERVKRSHPQTEVVIVSGFDRFEYAKTAIRVGVFDYLVKPVSPKEFERVLNKLVAKVKDNRYTAYNSYLHSGLSACDFLSDQSGSIICGQEGEVQRSLRYPSQWKQEFTQILEQGDCDAVRVWLDACVNALQDAQLPMECVYGLFLNLSTECLRQISKHQIPAEHIFGEGFSPYAQLHKQGSLEEAQKWILDISSRTIEACNKNQEETKRSRRLAAAAKELIDLQFADPDFSAGQIARQLYVSEGYLRSSFKQTFRQTVAAYANSLRMKKAMSLLQEGGIKISDISRMIGYNDAAYFSRAFKREFGHAPSYYEKPYQH